MFEACRDVYVERKWPVERVGTRPGRDFALGFEAMEYPPPDPDGRPHIWIVFDFGKKSELDLGDFGGAMATIRKRQLELSEGVGVILFDNDGDEWVLIDAVGGSVQSATR
jgi:hypothetical protein